MVLVQTAGCVEIGQEDESVRSTMLGQVASMYYLKHQTMAGFAAALRGSMSPADVSPSSTP